MVLIKAPDVDMLTVSKSSRDHRKSITGIAPKIGLKIIDYGRLADIDNFYTECQNFRDFYRDPYNKLNKPYAFTRHYGRCGRASVDINSILLQQPVVWRRQYQPVVYAVDYGHALNVGDRISLSGQYNPTACFVYKQ